MLSEFLIFESNLFHSAIVEKKKYAWITQCNKTMQQNSKTKQCNRILLHCFVLYDILCVGIHSHWRYFGECDFSILKIQQSFLYQLHC